MKCSYLLLHSLENTEISQSFIAILRPQFSLDDNFMNKNLTLTICFTYLQFIELRSFSISDYIATNERGRSE
jgi:hypothetical protein